MARKLFTELDGKVDALGVGGIDLMIGTMTRMFPIRGAFKLIENVKHTPVVDGRGLKHTLEYRA
ncbi:MAG: quinate 5-dehydrogenase, partial [Syntrophales bacterium LBB04]|nr:quinate 5-dehydrogenase [Syntrophales bacterium LBB04]